MTSACDLAHQSHPWLVEGARALDDGQFRWFTEATAETLPAARSKAESDLVTIQRVAAEIQRAFACCRLGRVRALLAEVETLLPLSLKTLRRGHATVEPPPELATAGLAHLYWRAACVVWRERVEYELLQRRFGRGDLPMQQLLSGGFELESVWVLCDPWWRGSRSDNEVETKQLILPWATALRRINRPTAAQVDAQALRRARSERGARGERAVFEGAMYELVEHGLRPWAAGSGVADRLPVRIPYLRAYEQAARWVQDQSW